jgi:hypothetical protein
VHSACVKAGRIPLHTRVRCVHCKREERGGTHASVARDSFKAGNGMVEVTDRGFIAEVRQVAVHLGLILWNGAMPRK